MTQGVALQVGVATAFVVGCKNEQPKRERKAIAPAKEKDALLL